VLKIAVPLVVLAAALGGAASWFYGAEGALPRPARSRTEDPVRRNRTCEDCHADIAEEWRGSQHRSAFTDPTFQAALAVEPNGFCRGCHAPEAPGIDGSAEAQALGVGCVTCHLAGDAVLGGPHDGLALPPHRVARSPAFATAAACASCHEFAFDDDAHREAPLTMQSTVTEHAASEHADQSCAECHMPRTASGHRSHAFASTRDPEAHRRAVVVRAERLGPSTLRVRLTTDGVGHAYPTGDLFRRVAVHAEVEGPEHRVVGSADAFLARHWTTGRDLDDAPVRVEARDDRIGSVPGEPTIVDLELGPGAAGQPIHWVVTLDRVLHVADHREAAAVVSDRVELAAGAVPP
jgi:hypothetical protein